MRRSGLRDVTELWDRLSTATQEADGVRRQREAVRVMGGRKRPGPGLGKSLLVLQQVTDGWGGLHFIMP